jgi:hypothetical protein
MSPKALKTAWQPLTPKGVAAFAKAPTSRLLLVQLFFALLTAGVVCVWVNNCWFKIITKGVSNLPDKGEIRDAQLYWYGDSPVLLAENRFLAIAVDLHHAGRVRSPAHAEVEFGLKSCKISSLLGYFPVRYPSGYIIAFNRGELGPWWGAWHPALLGIMAILLIVTLLGVWALLAALYSLPTWILGFFADRGLSLPECWRLSGAALMPGCLFLTVAILVYGLGFLDLVQLGFAMAVHLIIGWLATLLGTLAFPKNSASQETENPFAHRESNKAEH